MEYDVNLSRFCPVEIQQIVRQADVRQSSAGLIFDQLTEIGTADFNCLLNSIGYVGQSLNSSSNPTAITAWLTEVATYAGYFQPEQLKDLKDVLVRLAVPEGNGLLYFAALRRNGIDIRKHLVGRVSPDWAFSKPRDVSATAWHYNLYLARFRDAKAVEALAEKIAMTTGGNDVTLLLNSLADVGTTEVREVVKIYVNDSRSAEGVDGPGLLVSETVALLLSQTLWQ